MECYLSPADGPKGRPIFLTVAEEEEDVDVGAVIK